MKKECKIEIRMSEDLMKKLAIISKKEGRSINNQFLFLLRNNIQYFERTHGRLTNAELAAELVAYMTSEPCAARIAGIWPPCRYSVLESEAFLTSNARIKPEQMASAVAASIGTGLVFMEALTHLERTADHCSNIAVTIIELSNNRFDTHRYIHSVAYNTEGFREDYKRYSENRKFLLMIDRIKDRSHRYYACPKCRQTVRVPRGKGKIAITCPKCREKFIKKT